MTLAVQPLGEEHERRDEPGEVRLDDLAGRRSVPFPGRLIAQHPYGHDHHVDVVPREGAVGERVPLPLLQGVEGQDLDPSGARFDQPLAELGEPGGIPPGEQDPGPARRREPAHDRQPDLRGATDEQNAL